MKKSDLLAKVITDSKFIVEKKFYTKHEHFEILDIPSIMQTLSFDT